MNNKGPSRKLRVIITNPGGNATPTSNAYKLTLPSKWMKEMGISDDSRFVDVSYSDGVITIKKSEDK